MWSRRTSRDVVRNTKVWIIVVVNDVSAQGVQEDGEGYDKVLRQLSAKMRCELRG